MTRGRSLLLAAALVAASVVIAPAPPLGAREGRAALAPEVAWLFPAARGPGWGELDLGAAPPGASAQVGSALFAARCAACHGAEGRGDGLLAQHMRTPPPDLARAPLRTRDATGAVGASELVRTITVGAPAHGMPSFAHLLEEERWSLALFVLSLREDDPAPRRPVELPPRPAEVDPALGRRVFLDRCALCHGERGDGKGPAGPTLVDAAGRPTPATDLTFGPAALRGGARPEDIARTVVLGRPGTAMVPVDLTPEQLWSVAAYVANLVAEGEAARRAAWDAFFSARRESARVAGAERGPSPARFDPRRSERFAVAPDGRRGCTACHEGIAPIATGTMGVALDAFAGGHPDRTCSVCHEGQWAAATKDEAHAGMIGNPGSLWVTSVGAGCAKCHSERGALTSLHGRPLPEPAGGAFLSVRSRRTDPTGASGANHAYRIQRALMAQETGKVFLATASVGLVEPDAPRYTDFALDDPDGPVPCAGSPAYRETMARAFERGHLRRLEGGEALPTRARTAELLGSEAAGAYLDYYRKECGRCHLWGEGKAARGEHRSSGCSACHVPWNERGLSAGDDPTIPTNKPGHPYRHEVILRIPEQQCNHCHTRGHQTKHSDVHQVAGIECIDCHTSIDVHGDGNIYPSIGHQLEVKCEDCHGTPTHAPWELPLLPGTPAAGDAPRGVHALDGREHLLTSRGNVRANWLRRDGQVVVVSFMDGREHVAPLLRDQVQPDAAPDPEAEAPGSPHAALIAGHDALACAACHNRAGPSCGACHVTYFDTMSQQDWLLSALDYDPATTRQRVVSTQGAIEFRDTIPGWGLPDFRRDPDGRIGPRIHGCDVSFNFIDRAGKITGFAPRMNPRTPGYPPPVAPSLPHERSIPARACTECHVDGRVVLPGKGGE